MKALFMFRSCRTTRTSIQWKSHKLRLFYFLYSVVCSRQELLYNPVILESARVIKLPGRLPFRAAMRRY
jgi:hypothetical protein